MKRIYYLDFSKALATFLVVFGHLYSIGSPIRIPIYAFHMPFFFLVSGIFHSYNATIQYKKYFTKLIVPTIIFIVIAIVVEPLYSYIFDGCNYLIEFKHNIVKTAVLFIKGDNIGIYWFLVVLFLVKLATDLYLKLRYKYACIILWLLLTIVSIKTKLPLYISQMVMALPFYLLGYTYKDMLKSIQTIPMGRVKSIAMSILILLTFLGLNLLNGKVSMLSVSYGKLPSPVNVLVFYLNALLGSALVIIISILVKKQFRLVNTISNSLITIVGLQGLFTHLFYWTIGYDQPIYLSALVAFVIMLLCCLLHKLISRIYP